MDFLRHWFFCPEHNVWYVSRSKESLRHASCRVQIGEVYKCG